MEEFVRVEDSKTLKFLKSIREIKFMNLTGKDVVRHELVQKIIEAYEKPKRY